MSTTLATLRDRVEAVLRDSSNLIWASGDIDEAIRQALAEYNLSLGASCQIDDLDSAPSTTLPATDESMLVMGAAGYAAVSRVVDRVENFNLSQQAPAVLVQWGENRLGFFRRMLDRCKIRNFTAGEQPFGGAPWPQDKWDT